MTFRPPYSIEALIVLVLAAGCGRRVEREVEDAKPTSAQPSASSYSVKQVEILRNKNHVLEDSQDGWTSEAVSAQAANHLNQLFSQFLDRSKDVHFLSPDFRCDSLIPSQLESAYSDSYFQVRRMRHAVRGSNAFPEAIKEFQNYWTDFDNKHFKLKLFRIVTDGERVETRQLFHVSGESNSLGKKEQNSTLLAIWRRQNNGELSLQSIRVEAFEEVDCKLPRFFRDETGDVLSDSLSFQMCLKYGIRFWKKNLEGRFGVFNFGHHGIAIGDVNGDYLDDMYVCETGGLPNHLYLQQVDGRLRDISRRSRADFLDNTRSALFLDLDNDGDQDLSVAFAKGLVFLENDGSGNFEERARFKSVLEAHSIVAADYDGDRNLDLFVCVYSGTDATSSELPGPYPYYDATNGGANFLIRNLGNWKFENATPSSGMDDENHRFTFAAAWEDYDNDGDQDLFVVNDFGPNQLYRNDAGKFSEIGKKVGLVDGAFGMSASFGDFDRNGMMDIYVGNMFSAAGNRVTFQPQFKAELDSASKSKLQHLARGNSLFRNQAGRFDDVSLESGTTMGRWSWGALFSDINNDGWEDLLVGNGFITGETPDDL